MGVPSWTGQGDRHPPRLAIGCRTFDAVRQVVSFPGWDYLHGVSSTFTGTCSVSVSLLDIPIPVGNDHNNKAHALRLCPPRIPPSLALASLDSPVSQSCPCLPLVSSIIFARHEAISKQTPLPACHTTLDRPVTDQQLGRPHTAGTLDFAHNRPDQDNKAQHSSAQHSTAQHTS